MSAGSVALNRDRAGDGWSADEWFAALDQRQIGAGTGTWVAQVLAVHPDSGGMWVQMAPAHDPCATLVLRISPSTSLEDVLLVLEHRDATGLTRPEIVDLSR